MKFPILFSLLLSSLAFGGLRAQSNQQQPQQTADYPMQKNGESESETQDTNQPLTAEQKAQKQADHLQKKLGLSEEQKQKVYDINLNRINQAQALKAKKQNSTDKTGNKAEIQKIRTDYDTALTNILNVDQQKIWTQMKADAQAKKAQHQQNKSKGKPHTIQESPADDTDLN